MHLCHNQHPLFSPLNWLTRCGCYWHKRLFLRNIKKHRRSQKQLRQQRQMKQSQGSSQHPLRTCSSLFPKKRETKSSPHSHKAFLDGRSALIFDGEGQNTQPSSNRCLMRMSNAEEHRNYGNRGGEHLPCLDKQAVHLFHPTTFILKQ